MEWLRTVIFNVEKCKIRRVKHSFQTEYMNLMGESDSKLQKREISEFLLQMIWSHLFSVQRQKQRQCKRIQEKFCFNWWGCCVPLFYMDSRTSFLLHIRY